MKCSVLIDSNLISKDEVRILNEPDKGISFSSTETSSFLPAEMVLILIDLAQNIGYSAAYDAIKKILIENGLSVDRTAGRQIG